MSLLIHVTPILTQIRTIGNAFSHRFLGMTPSQKIIMVTVTASVTLLGVLARYMRRKRQVVDPKKYRRWTGGKRSRASGMKSPNGDVGSVASGSRRSEGAVRGGRPGSVVTVSERNSVASGSLAGSSQHGDATQLTPQQLGVMGMEALETSINYWEDALSSYTAAGGPLVLLGPEEAGFCRDLQLLLEAAYGLQDQSELLFLDQRSVLFRPDSGDRASSGRTVRSPSLVESFASAVADLRDFEDCPELFGDEPPGGMLYQLALRHLEDGGGIPCRIIRTELVGCGSDSEYLAKLHCLRLAFQHMLRDASIWTWFADAGRQTLADMLLYADRDPKDFLVGYEAMLEYLRNGDSWPGLEQELCARGVKALTFYDVVMDYILMDAFEDLDAPPSSVTAVVQNRWLSNGFKETALTTAVWSVLKAKRRMLKFPSGFMAHFYVISEQLLPLLAWGFLGPDEPLRDTCVYFKDQVMGLLVDIFSFQKCRFTTVDELAVDVLQHLKGRVGNVSQRLCTQ